MVKPLDVSDLFRFAETLHRIFENPVFTDSIQFDASGIAQYLAFCRFAFISDGFFRDSIDLWDVDPFHVDNERMPV